ncbi:hypothetical protein KBC75_05880 [Candidatus Shapirobacteria bacterium]|nr:hypothetical protein [Candidatus Shapirobacteria bacterium]
MNKTEIERKFLVNIMPDLSGIPMEEQDRYFLELGEKEKRITRINNRYIYEEKTKGNGLTAEKIVREISKDEFEKFKLTATNSLERKSYVLSKSPEVLIKVYSGVFDGLVRAEFEFENEDEAKKFVSPDWVGKEITETEIGRDGRLIQLSREEFLEILEALN